VLGNHDRPRIASRVGPEQARIAAMLLLTLRGTPTVYYGDEIAMQEAAIAPDQVRDPLGKTVPLAGTGAVPPCNGTARPTPVSRRSSRGCPSSFLRTTFSLSAAMQRRSIGSTAAWSICAANVQLCRSAVIGSVRAEGNLLVFTREHGRERLLVALNFGGTPQADIRIAAKV